jgi:hypothetical protein
VIYVRAAGESLNIDEMLIAHLLAHSMEARIAALHLKGDTANAAPL